MSNSFYSEKELQQMNFKYIGKNVLVSRKASIYGIENISIDDNSRIDDFCILSGNITIGKNVHIAAACLFFSGDCEYCSGRLFRCFISNNHICN